MNNKKEKINKDKNQEKLKAAKQQYLKQKQMYKERVSPLVKFLRQKKLRFEHAQVGSQRIQYFRIDEFQKLVADNKQHIQGDQKLNNLIKQYSDQFVFFKRPNNIKIKYPKTLQPVLPSDSQKKYASFRFDTTQSKSWMTILIIVSVFALVLFPIWPFQLKYAIWWISLVLLVVLVGIIIVRLIVFIICAIFNYHIWIFPNFLYSNGFFDSFIPVIQITKGDKSWFNIFVRLTAIGLFMLMSFHIYMNPTFLDDNIQFTKQTISQVHDWGVSKIKNEKTFAQRAITDLNDILNETSDVAQETKVDTQQYVQSSVNAQTDQKNQL